MLTGRAELRKIIMNSFFLRDMLLKGDIGEKQTSGIVKDGLRQMIGTGKELDIYCQISCIHLRSDSPVGVLVGLHLNL